MGMNPEFATLNALGAYETQSNNTGVRNSNYSLNSGGDVVIRQSQKLNTSKLLEKVGVKQKINENKRNLLSGPYSAKFKLRKNRYLI